MPITKSAKKKLRKDKTRKRLNDQFRELLAKNLKKAKKNPSKDSISTAFKTIDKLAKKHLLHKNKAARLKSGLAKLIKTKAPQKSPKKSNK